MITTEDIRRVATALPEVEETSHFLFHVPLVKVPGKTFVGMGREEMKAVFCVSEQQARSAAAADPATYKAVRRTDARWSFLGLQVQLNRVSEKRIRGLADDAWRNKAPKRLVGEHDWGASAWER